MMMNDEKVITALREWASEPVDYDSDENKFLDGVAAAKQDVLAIIDPPKPKWRESVDRCVNVKAFPSDPLGDVLMHLSALSAPEADDATREWRLVCIIAICEEQVGDGWQADPDRVPVGHWGIPWLLVPLSQEPPAWHALGNRAAAWLRSLTDGGAA